MIQGTYGQAWKVDGDKAVVAETVKQIDFDHALLLMPGVRTNGSIATGKLRKIAIQIDGEIYYLLAAKKWKAPADPEEVSNE